MWYNGEVDLFPQADYGKADPDMTNFEEWGHYSQVVWKSTTGVGCAAQFCDKGTIFDDMGSWFSVCNYFPAGKPLILSVSRQCIDNLHRQCWWRLRYQCFPPSRPSSHRRLGSLLLKHQRRSFLNLLTGVGKLVPRIWFCDPSFRLSSEELPNLPSTDDIVMITKA